MTKIFQKSQIPGGLLGGGGGMGGFRIDRYISNRSGPYLGFFVCGGKLHKPSQGSPVYRQGFWSNTGGGNCPPAPPRYVRPCRWQAQESKQRWQLQASHLCTDWMQFIKAVFWQTNRRILLIYHTEQSLSLIGLSVLENPLSSACLQPNQFLKRFSVNTSH